MKKVRILPRYNKKYANQIGIVYNDDGTIWRVRMSDGAELLPFSPDHIGPECELVEEPKELPIFN